MPATGPASEASSVGRPGDRPPPDTGELAGRVASRCRSSLTRSPTDGFESDARDMLPRGTAGQPREGDARPNHPNAETTAARQIVALLTMKICYPALSSPQGHIDDRTALRSSPWQLQRPPPRSGDSFRVRQLRQTRPGAHLGRPAA